MKGILPRPSDESWAHSHPPSWGSGLDSSLFSNCREPAGQNLKAVDQSDEGHMLENICRIRY